MLLLLSSSSSKTIQKDKVECVEHTLQRGEVELEKYTMSQKRLTLVRWEWWCTANLEWRQKIANQCIWEMQYKIGTETIYNIQRFFSRFVSRLMYLSQAPNVWSNAAPTTWRKIRNTSTSMRRLQGIRYHEGKREIRSNPKS
jgi:hypothetical protein